MRHVLGTLGVVLILGCGPHDPETSSTGEMLCRADAQCEEGLVCQGGACRPELRARFCNCARLERLTLELDDVSLAAEFGSCSPCQRIPWGEAVGYRIRDDAKRELERGHFDLEVPGPTDFLFEPSLGDGEAHSSPRVPDWVVGCEDTRWQCAAAGE